AEILKQAEDLFAKDDLPKAEKLYLDVLASSEARDHRRVCYDRLLAIYLRGGRFDRAIQHGKEFLAWLKESDDAPRLRLLNLAIGWSYVQLGHHDDAEKPLREALKPLEGFAPIPTKYRLTALTLLARGEEKRERPKDAAKLWQEAEELALTTLMDPDPEIKPQV